MPLLPPICSVFEFPHTLYLRSRAAHAGRRSESMNDPLKPSPALLCKLGSILVHAEELISPTGHPFDAEAMRTTWDFDVCEWMKQMDKMGMLPVKR